MSKQSRGWGDIAERISPVWELLEAEVDVESKTQLSTCFWRHGRQDRYTMK